MKTPQQRQRDLIIAFSIIIGLLLCIAASLYNTRVSAFDAAPTPTLQVIFFTATVLPPSPPVPIPTPAHVGVNGNPWGYDFTPGQLLYSPVPGFCAGQYFQCVSTFWEDSSGYVVECRNGLYSHSGGIHGACSRDGGVWRPLYTHDGRGA